MLLQLVHLPGLVKLMALLSLFTTFGKKANQQANIVSYIFAGHLVVYLGFWPFSKSQGMDFGLYFLPRCVS